MKYELPFLLHRSVSYLNLDYQQWRCLLPTLIYPLITSSAIPKDPSGASKSDSPSTYQTTCTVFASGISAYITVRQNMNISLFKSPIVDWVPNKTKVVSAYGPGLGRHISPCLVT